MDGVYKKFKTQKHYFQGGKKLRSQKHLKDNIN